MLSAGLLSDAGGMSMFSKTLDQAKRPKAAVDAPNPCRTAALSAIASEKVGTSHCILLPADINSILHMLPWLLSEMSS